MQFTCCIKCSFTVNYCNKASNRIVSKTKGFSVFFWITLSHEVSRHFPTYTSTYVNFENLPHICCTLADIPLHWWRIRCLVEGGTKSWIVSSRLPPYSDFPKHSWKSRTVPCEPNPGRCLICIGSQIYNKINR